MIQAKEILEIENKNNTEKRIITYIEKNIPVFIIQYKEIEIILSKYDFFIIKEKINVLKEKKAEIEDIEKEVYNMYGGNNKTIILKLLTEQITIIENKKNPKRKIIIEERETNLDIREIIEEKDEQKLIDIDIVISTYLEKQHRIINRKIVETRKISKKEIQEVYHLIRCKEDKPILYSALRKIRIKQRKDTKIFEIEEIGKNIEIAHPNKVEKTSYDKETKTITILTKEIEVEINKEKKWKLELGKYEIKCVQGKKGYLSVRRIEGKIVPYRNYINAFMGCNDEGISPYKRICFGNQTSQIQKEIERNNFFFAIDKILKIINQPEWESHGPYVSWKTLWQEQKGIRICDYCEEMTVDCTCEECEECGETKTTCDLCDNCFDCCRCELCQLCFNNRTNNKTKLMRMSGTVNYAAHICEEHEEKMLEGIERLKEIKEYNTDSIIRFLAENRERTRKENKTSHNNEIPISIQTQLERM